MKVLHLWSTAGIGGLLAKYMDQVYPSFESDCIMRKKYDPNRLTVKGTVYKGNWLSWFFVCLTKPRKFHIIHIHSYDWILPILKVIYPHKKYVLHYHGTEIRGNWAKRRHLYRLADQVLVSTPDLLEGAPYHVKYLPNPIDYDLIDSVNIPSEAKARQAFHLDQGAIDKAKIYARERGLKLVIPSEKVPHEDFLKTLCEYYFYIDVKRDKARTHILRALSLTALEAFYAGAIVINFKGKALTRFPKRHEKAEVCKALYRIYFDLTMKAEK
jgi:hypothetical protein